VKTKALDLFSAAMSSEIFARDRIFCQSVQAQVGQAVRMNHVRLKELTDAWRFLFFHVCHPHRGQDQIDMMDTLSENRDSLFSGSRWISRDLDHWHIRLKNGRRIHFCLSEEPGNMRELQTSVVDLWRLLRECQLAEIDAPDAHAPNRRHCDVPCAPHPLWRESARAALPPYIE
jgi:phosphatidylserine/phosphatidylglycerophosphate/cardiolipin synthase-like enzyme